MPVRTTLFPVLFAIAAVTGSASAVSAQSNTEALAIELNNVSDVDGACRLTYVATNSSGVALAGLAYEIVLYDAEGIVPDNGFLLFEFGRFPEGKTKVVQFILEDRSCDGISRILVNDVAECRSETGEHDFCLEGLSVTSRNDIDFTL